MSKEYYIYLLTNKHNNVLYTGVSNDLIRRIYEHKNKLQKGFTEKYNVERLVYYEIYADIADAIMREKQIKGWSRKRKMNLLTNLIQNGKIFTKIFANSPRIGWRSLVAKSAPRDDTWGVTFLF